jgi:UDPglucose--hexose-1-phosphate uridylyltransferase
MENENDPNEFRSDFLGRGVVLTPRRSSRPHDFEAHSPQKKSDPKDCFFCPGNEKMCPPEIDRVEKGGKWSLRVFPNKFPAFSKNTPKAYGTHEVVVETSDHFKTLSQIPQQAMLDYLMMVAKRLRAHARDKKIKYTCIFKNEWQDAGASLEHTHTQLVAMDEVPQIIKKEGKLAMGHCPFCSLPIDDTYPKIENTGPFVWLAPYVPRFNNETWIMPRAHIASLADLDESAIAELAALLLRALTVQDAELNYPAYNIIWHIAPHRLKNFHFHIEICPRTAKWAGFEYGTEIVMNSVKPEWTAEQYRERLRGMQK